jgi:glycosyltransferase involved in cell wall biosynthesis
MGLFSLQNLWRCVRADRAIQAGRGEEAACLWLSALESADAHSDPALVVRAVGGLRKLGQERSALKHLERICSGKTTPWRVRQEWARLLFETGCRSQAIGVWNGLLSDNAPLNEAAVLKIAAGFCEEGALARAVEILARAVKRLGANPKLETALSNAEFEAGIRPSVAGRDPQERGSVLFVPCTPEGAWRHLEKVLGFDQILVAGRPDSDWKRADAFAVFEDGRRTKGNALCRSLASFAGKPLWRISLNPLARPREGGMAFFIDLDAPEEPGGLDVEQNGKGDFKPSEEELERAKKCLGMIRNRKMGFPEFNISKAADQMESNETLIESFAAHFLKSGRYYIEGKGVMDCEAYLSHLGDNEFSFEIDTGTSFLVQSPKPLRILFILPSGRFGATGRYVQVLAEELMEMGALICILADGDVPSPKPGKPIWWKMEFAGPRLTEEIRRAVLNFSPDWVYLNGVRTRAQRAALEAVALTGARLAMHSEDEDVTLHALNHGQEAAHRMAALDKPAPSLDEVAEFLRSNDWDHTLGVFRDPAHDRWTEPVLRATCQHLTCLHTAIWHPFAERLQRNFAAPVLVVPPVAARSDFEAYSLDADEREQALAGIGLDGKDFVLYVAGTIYSYSNEFEIFLNACVLAANELEVSLAVVVSGRSELPLDEMAERILRGKVKLVNLRQPSDSVYTRFLKVADLVCSPGVPDEFNRLRLPSRLVRAMAMGRPVLTCRHGFGESLDNLNNAFLTDGIDPEKWKTAILDAAKSDSRIAVGQNGREFALQYFGSKKIAQNILEYFNRLTFSQIT